MSEVSAGPRHAQGAWRRAQYDPAMAKKQFEALAGRPLASADQVHAHVALLPELVQGDDADATGEVINEGAGHDSDPKALLNEAEDAFECTGFYQPRRPTASA